MQSYVCVFCLILGLGQALEVEEKSTADLAPLAQFDALVPVPTSLHLANIINSADSLILKTQQQQRKKKKIRVKKKHKMDHATASAEQGATKDDFSSLNIWKKQALQLNGLVQDLIKSAKEENYRSLQGQRQAKFG